LGVIIDKVQQIVITSGLPRCFHVRTTEGWLDGCVWKNKTSFKFRISSRDTIQRSPRHCAMWAGEDDGDDDEKHPKHLYYQAR
jgi:hypothetical protein